MNKKLNPMLRSLGRSRYAPNGLIAEEKVLDVCVNQGKYALVLLQERDKLQRARKILQKQDYYKYWTEEYYKEVVDDM